MRIGLIARAENTGLGIQTWELHRHIQPAKTLVVRLARGGRHFFPDRFPGATISAGLPSIGELEEFLDGLDLVFTCETPYTYDLFTLAERRGIATVLQYNFELLDYLARPDLPRPTVLAAPSSWHYEDVLDRSLASLVQLPVPVALDRFPAPERRRGPARRFLHIVGRPAIHDRNGTADLLDALAFVRTPITVTIRCQDHTYVPRLMRGRRLPAHVDVRLDHYDIPDYWRAYDGHDVLVLPRRFGGLCLPMQEALGAGMPVLMPDISPNNAVLPRDWLVPAEHTGQFKARSMIDLHTTDAAALADKIDLFATNRGVAEYARERAHQLAQRMSWGQRLSLYHHLFESLR